MRERSTCRTAHPKLPALDDGGLDDGALAPQRPVRVSHVKPAAQGAPIEQSRAPASRPSQTCVSWSQAKPNAQSTVVVQSVTQAPNAGAHANGPQSNGIAEALGHVAPGATQNAGPTPWLVSVQREGAHSAPPTSVVHSPAPLQVPEHASLRPHCARRSSPFGCWTQTPGDVGNTHVSQTFSQGESQQTPSTQKPLAHSLPDEQLTNEPVTFGVLPPGARGDPSGNREASVMPASKIFVPQTFVVVSHSPEMQSLSLAQLVLHDMPSSAQTRPPGHGTAVAVGQSEATPLQLACETIPPAHAFAQIVTLAL